MTNNSGLPRLFVQLLLALLLSVMHVATTWAADPADAQAIVVSAVKGEVRVTMNGEARRVQKGTVIVLPATIQTGAHSSLDLKQDHTTVGIASDTTMEIPAQAAGLPLERIIQSSGNAFYSVGKRESKKLRVETPYLVAVIKGTQFNVAVQSDGATVSLFEGRLEIRATDGSDVVDLNAGEMAVRQRTDKSIRVIRLSSGEAVRSPTAMNDPAARPAPITSHSDNASPGVSAGSSGSRDGEGSDNSSTPRPASPLDGRVDDVLSGGNGGVTADVDVGSNAIKTGADIGIDGSPVAVTAGASVSVGSEIGVGVSAGVDAGAVDVGASAGVDIGSAGAAVDLSASVGAGAIDVGAAAGVAIGGGEIGLDAGVAVDAGPIGADVSAGADLGAGGVTADIGAGVDLPGAAVDVGLGAGIDAGTGAVDLGASVGAGVAGVDVGTDLSAGLNPGAGTVDVALDTSVTTPIDVGVGADVAAGVDLGAGTVDLGTDLGIATPVGGTDVGLTAGTGADAVDVGVDVGVGGLDLGVDLGVSTGGIDLGVDLAGSGTPAATPAPEPPSTGGLLGGLLGRLGRRN